MDRILRAQPGWQAELAEAIAAAPRPIRADPRLWPRQAGEQALVDRYDRSQFPAAREASTLLLLYPGADGSLTLPLTVRHADLRDHAGEISLPGGALEPGDASREAAALREAEEEIGVTASSIEVIGTLDDVWIPVSNFELRPFVGALDATPRLVPHEAEVVEVLELPVARLLADDAMTEEEIAGPGWRLRAGVYRWQGHRIWGATARTLSMLAAVLDPQAFAARE